MKANCQTRQVGALWKQAVITKGATLCRTNICIKGTLCPSVFLQQRESSHNSLCLFSRSFSHIIIFSLSRQLLAKFGLNSHKSCKTRNNAAHRQGTLSSPFRAWLQIALGIPKFPFSGDQSSVFNLSHGQPPSRSTLRILEKCPITTTGNVTCADLIVPERRDLNEGRSVVVRIAVLHPSTPEPKPDPLVFLMGGQGQGYSILDRLAIFPDLLQRNVITLEHRGTDMAGPFFGCPGVDNRLDDLDRNLVSQPSGEHPDQIRLCEAEIEANEIDKNGYDTEASADDLWDLKQLMGIREWNILGVSYGGRIAQSFLRKHPDQVRSFAIDSSQVPGVPLLFGYSRLKTVGRFFDNCAAAPECSKFGNLSEAFERTRDRLASNPVPVVAANRIQNLTAREYFRLVTWVLYTRPESAVRELPAAILAADEDLNYSPLLSLDERYADANPVVEWTPGQYLQAPNIAQQTGVLCKEEYPPLSWSGNNVTLSFPYGWTASVRRSQEEEQRAQARVCRHWDFQPSSFQQSQLPRNSVPALIVHGDHDTIAPSTDQNLLAESYPNSTRVTFPWTGHGITERRQGCFIPMYKTFIDDPGATLNTSCAETIHEPAWLQSSPAAGQPETYKPMMENVAANQLKDFGFPGISVHVILQKVNVSGTIAVGVADPSTGRQLIGDEPVRLASMTKTYTAAAVLRLFEQNRLQLDSTLDEYISPATQERLVSGGYRPDNITIRHLIHHTSGIPDYNDESYKTQVLRDPQYQWSPEKQIQWAIDHSQPTGAPGETHAYSDTGYVILGEVIKNASGMDRAPAYRSLLKFDQLGLRQTWYESLEPVPAGLPERAQQFIGSIDTTDFNPSFDLYGGGGLVSTVEDAALFLRALMLRQVFEHPDTLPTILSIPATNLESSTGPRTGFAMGIASFVEGNQLCWGHRGFWGTSFMYCPSQDLTIATSRQQSVDPPTDYDSTEILKTALRMNRLALYPAAPV